MQLAMVGLGRMGANLVRRLLRAGHHCVVHDRDPIRTARLESAGATAAGSLGDLASTLHPPRVVWIMVPAAVTGAIVAELAERLQPGDVIIDGGNTHYHQDIDRAAALAGQGIHYVDVGTSGGVFGLDRGFCLMVGGHEHPVRLLEPLFAALAPGVEAAPRTTGRTGPVTAAEQGWLHCGPPGAGHFVKMVHNGIEYGIMASYAEGLNILAQADIGTRAQPSDAETAPLRDAAYYRYRIDTAAVAEVWRRGSVVSSWLLDLTAAALHSDPALADLSGRVSDSGEGRWTVAAAIDEGVPAHVITAALYQRFSSRGENDLADRILSAMRRAFGGHTQPGSGL
jgi:6-phosphogluconate dehydrogenase